MRFSFRFLLVIVSVVAFLLLGFQRSNEPDWPTIVFDAKRELLKLDSELTISEFGAHMFDVGITKQAGPSFFKDFRYRWGLKRDSDTPNYVIEATFFPTIQNGKWKLRFATINQVSADTGGWKTVWSREFEPPDTIDLHPIVIY